MFTRASHSRETPSTIRSRLPFTLSLLWEFLLYDCAVLLGFPVVRALVRGNPTRRHRSISVGEVAAIGEAVRDACVVYFKPALCLQRSSAVTRLLRRRGAAAQLVIGTRQGPVKSHAWVELDGAIVSDAITGQEFYQVLERW
jgi:hypothetical protein